MVKEAALELTPFVRIGLWAGGGLLMDSGWSETYVGAITLDGTIAGSIAWGIAAAWYALAKWAGWRT